MKPRELALLGAFSFCQRCALRFARCKAEPALAARTADTNAAFGAALGGPSLNAPNVITPHAKPNTQRHSALEISFPIT